MPDPLPISVAIVAKNESDRLPLSLASVAGWVDEILVVDSGSTDGTPQIAEGFGAKVVFNAWPGFAPQKHFAQGLCRNDWVMCIDADEELSPELIAQVKALFAQGQPSEDAYQVPLLPIYNFQKKHRPITVHRYPIKLYRKSKGTIRGDLGPLDDTVKMQPGTRVGRLKGMLNHYSFRSIYDHIDKMNWSSENQATGLYQRGKNPGVLELLLVPSMAFFKQYILRKEIFNGIDGILVSHLFAFQRFMRIAKARERFSGCGFGPDAKIGDKSTPAQLQAGNIVRGGDDGAGDAESASDGDSGGASEESSEGGVPAKPTIQTPER